MKDFSPHLVHFCIHKERQRVVSDASIQVHNHFTRAMQPPHACALSDIACKHHKVISIIRNVSNFTRAMQPPHACALCHIACTVIRQIVIIKKSVRNKIEVRVCR